MTSRSHGKSQQPQPFLYRSLSGYLKGVFGAGIRKVPIDPGFGCPHRKGGTGSGGCSFCRTDSFVPEHARSGRDPVDQIQAARKGKTQGPFIAYLQAGTATNAPVERVRQVVNSVCRHPGVVGLFVGTRPDCVDEEIIEVFTPWLSRRLVWLELGLQSSHDGTLQHLNRGHTVEDFIRARNLAGTRGIPVCAHVILGLPGEGEDEMMATAGFLADQQIEGVKIHHLQVLRGTDLERQLERGEVVPLDHRVYPELIAAFLEHLPPWTVIHRLLADAPEDLLVAPQWPPRNSVIRSIRGYMETEGVWQGEAYRSPNG